MFLARTINSTIINKTLSVDSVSADKRPFVDVNNEKRSSKLRKTQSDIDAEDDKIWAENLKPGTLISRAANLMSGKT